MFRTQVAVRTARGAEWISIKPVVRHLALWAAVLGFILWTYVAVATGGSFAFHETFNPYEWFAQAVLVGQLHFLVEPSPALLALPDPYDWTARRELIQSGVLNGSNYVHDAMYYQGRFYLSSGPSPVLLHVFWHLVTGRGLSDPAATTAYGFLGCVGFALLVNLIRRSEFPETPEWLAVLLVLVFALGGVSLHVVGLSQVYGEAVAATACFVIWGMVFWWVGTRGERYSALYLAVAGLFFGLAIASRLSALGYLLAASVFGTVACLQWGSRRKAVSGLLAIWGSCLLALALYLAYNAARFGHPLEYGTKYVLISGDASTRSTSLLVTTFLGLNLWSYLGPPVAFLWRFPFVIFRGGSITVVEGVSYITEAPLAPMYLLCPLALLAPIPAVIALGRLRRWPISRLTLLLFLAAGGSAFCLAIMLTIVAAAARYIQDPLPGALLVAVIGIFGLYRALTRHLVVRRLVVGAVVLLSVTSILGGSALLFNLWGGRLGVYAGLPQSSLFGQLAYASDCVTETVAKRISPDTWVTDYLATDQYRWGTVFVPGDADIGITGVVGAPIWGMRLESRLAGPRQVTVLLRDQVVAETTLYPGAQTLRFQTAGALDAFGRGAIRLQSQESMGGCDDVLWRVRIGRAMMGTLDDAAQVTRLLNTTGNAPRELPATPLEQSRAVTGLHRAYALVLSELDGEARIIRQGSALERQLAGQLEVWVRELQNPDRSQRRSENDLRQELARLESENSQLRAERDQLDAQLTRARAFAAPPPSTSIPQGFVPSDSQGAWEIRIVSIRHTYALRLEDAVSEVAGARSELNWLRTGPVHVYKEAATERERVEPAEQRAGNALNREIIREFEARNALRLEIERLNLSLKLVATQAAS